MSRHRSAAYRAQQQDAEAIDRAYTARYSGVSDGYTSDIAARVAAIHARLMADKTGDYKNYILGGGDMLGFGEGAKNEYRAFVREDLSDPDFDAYRDWSPTDGDDLTAYIYVNDDGGRLLAIADKTGHVSYIRTYDGRETQDDQGDAWEETDGQSLADDLAAFGDPDDYADPANDWDGNQIDLYNGLDAATCRVHGHSHAE